jgi:WD40 repeat protein
MRRLLAAAAGLAAVGCGSPQDEVVETWSRYHGAMRAGDVASVRSLLAAGRDAELAGPEAAAALELRSALVPEAPSVEEVEVSAVRASVTVVGAIEGQTMTGRISFTKEAGTWKVLEEEWKVDLTGAFPVPDVDLAALYAEGPGAWPQNRLSIAAHEGDVTAIAFTRDGQRLVSIGYGDRRIGLWDVASGELLAHVDGEHRPCDLAMLPDGSAVYVVDATGHVTEWPIDWMGFGTARVLEGVAGTTPRIAIAADGRQAVTTGWDEPAKLWDLEAGRFTRALPQSDRMRGVAFSPVAAAVACGSAGDYFAVWDLERLSWPVGARRKHRVPDAMEQSDVWCVAFSPDGRRLATGHMDSSISVWDMEKNRQVHNWYVQDCSVKDVTFSPCGTVLATAQQDGKVHLWETETRRALARLQAHEGSASSLAFNPADGVTLATGGEDGAIRIWQ